MTDRLIPQGDGWQFACVICRAGWRQDESMQVIAEHWNGHAGTVFEFRGVRYAVQLDRPMLELVWAGHGPEPGLMRRN